MLNQTAADLDRVFFALSDPIRRAILERLASGPATATELAEPFDVAMPAVSKHLKHLEEVGMVVRRREGRFHRFELAAPPLRRADEWLAYFQRHWQERFEALTRCVPPAWSVRADARMFERAKELVVDLAPRMEVVKLALEMAAHGARFADMGFTPAAAVARRLADRVAGDGRLAEALREGYHAFGELQDGLVVAAKGHRTDALREAVVAMNQVMLAWHEQPALRDVLPLDDATFGVG